MARTNTVEHWLTSRTPIFVALIRLAALALTGFAILGTPDIAWCEEVTLQWDPVVPPADVSGYEVHYGLASGQYEWVASVDGAASSIKTVGNLQPGITYYFAVRSCSGDDPPHVSSFSNEVSVTIEPTDTDGDGIYDVDDPDDDNDEMPDTFENAHWGLDSKNPGDAELDFDGDGLTNLQECRLGLEMDPNDPDSDGDGIQDDIDSQPVTYNNMCGGGDIYVDGLVSDDQQCSATNSVVLLGTSAVMSNGKLTVVSPSISIESGFVVESNGTFVAISWEPCPACP